MITNLIKVWFHMDAKPLQTSSNDDQTYQMSGLNGHQTYHGSDLKGHHTYQEFYSNDHKTSKGSAL